MRAESTTGPRGVLYKTLISGGLTRSDSLTLGMAKISPESALSEHRHRQPRSTLCSRAKGRSGSTARAVRAGSAVFVPGETVQSCENTGAKELQLDYVLAADSFEDVECIFEQ